jgi:hypothetical protein
LIFSKSVRNNFPPNLEGLESQARVKLTTKSAVAFKNFFGTQKRALALERDGEIRFKKEK